uniref:RFamide-related peptide n=1 Tax=Mola mola TaxID=94237 RepID=A0A3Q3VK45_MOLML
MLVTMFLTMVLIMAGPVGAVASVYELSNNKTLSGDNGRQDIRNQLHQQTKNKIHRSLDMESFNIQVIPTTSKVSHPIIVRLHPPTAKPVHMLINMPMRFGRDSVTGDDQTPNSNPNMPQRFGRSGKGIQLCAECPGVGGILKQPHTLVTNSHYWSLINHSHLKSELLCLP